jgi:cell division protein DivIC
MILFAIFSILAIIKAQITQNVEEGYASMKQEKKESIVTRLNNQYTENKTLQSIREHKYKKFVKRRTTAIIVGGLLLVGAFTYPLVRGFAQVNELEEERELAMQELQALELHQEDLEYYIGLLENEEYVAKLARSEYYLTQDNEIVFSFPEDRNPDYQQVLDEETDTEEENEEE